MSQNKLLENWHATFAVTLSIALLLAASVASPMVYFVKSAEAATAYTLTVRSLDLSGNTLSGMYTTIRSSSGTILKTGYTPLTFTGSGGSSYAVTVSDYGSRTFDHWGDGSTSRTRTITLNEDFTANAYFKTSTTTVTHPVLTVKSAELSGNSITGMYVTIKSSSGSTLKTGFTTTTYTANGGSSYSITVSDYNGRTFDHWDNGATSRTRTLTLTQDKTITAYYKTGSTTTTTTTTSGATGVYIPLYMYPGGTGWTQWQKVIDTKNAHPSVPFMAAINPNNGVGSYQVSAFVTGVDKLQAANIRVLGYISTDYADRSLDSVKAEIDKYVNWYGVNGIMIDEFSNQASDLSYFQSVYSYAKAKGLYVKANPGTDIPESYVGTADNFSITEGSGYFSLSLIEGWHTDYNKSKWSFTRHSTSWLDTSFVKAAAPYVGYMYITDGVSPDRYSLIPYYFGTMVTTLDNMY